MDLRDKLCFIPAAPEKNITYKPITTMISFKWITYYKISKLFKNVLIFLKNIIYSFFQNIFLDCGILYGYSLSIYMAPYHDQSQTRRHGKNLQAIKTKLKKVKQFKSNIIEYQINAIVKQEHW